MISTSGHRGSERTALRNREIVGVRLKGVKIQDATEMRIMTNSGLGLGSKRGPLRLQDHNDPCGSATSGWSRRIRGPPGRLEVAVQRFGPSSLPTIGSPRGPAGVMAGAEPLARLAVKILVKKRESRQWGSSAKRGSETGKAAGPARRGERRTSAARLIRGPLSGDSSFGPSRWGIPRGAYRRRSDDIAPEPR